MGYFTYGKNPDEFSSLFRKEIMSIFLLWLTAFLSGEGVTGVGAQILGGLRLYGFILGLIYDILILRILLYKCI